MKADTTVFMHEMFAKAHRGLYTILIFLILVIIFTISARQIVRHMLRNSSWSRISKSAMEDLAAVLVTGILGMLALWFVSKMR